MLVHKGFLGNLVSREDHFDSLMHRIGGACRRVALQKQMEIMTQNGIGIFEIEPKQKRFATRDTRPYRIEKRAFLLVIIMRMRELKKLWPTKEPARRNFLGGRRRTTGEHPCHNGEQNGRRADLSNHTAILVRTILPARPLRAIEVELSRL